MTNRLQASGTSRANNSTSMGPFVVFRTTLAVVWGSICDVATVAGADNLGLGNSGETQTSRKVGFKVHESCT